MDVAVYAVSFALQIAAPWWIVRRDQRRLSAVERARSWNEATFRLAVVVFGALSVATHFLRTRRSARGFGAGLLAAGASSFPASVVGAASAAWLDEPPLPATEALALALAGAGVTAGLSGLVALALVGADLVWSWGGRRWRRSCCAVT